MKQQLSRRSLLARTGYGLGVAAMQSLFGGTHFAPKAKRVIYLFQAGGPSHLDLLDYKPEMKDRFNQDIPPSVFGGQRITGMVASQDRLPVAPSMYGFKQHGQSGQWFSSLLPHTAKVADELCVLRACHTEAINHDPAITLLQTGSQLPGRPSMGAWVDYGLGSENANLPAFVVLNSLPSNGQPDQGLLARLWGAGFLPSRYQGVQFRNGKDPVLHLSNPPGLDSNVRRQQLDGITALNQHLREKVSDPEIDTRIAQYEMAFRMQTSVPELVDMSKEPESVLSLYGDDAKKPGSFAANCVLARRLAERNVRFIQLYHRGWDHHGGLTDKLPSLAKDVDQPSAGLIQDLKQRGMLDDTLVIWGGEFGRTPYAQGPLKPDNYGRDHHGRVFSMWMAGGGIKKGLSYGASDDYGFNVIEGGVHVHDLQATILHLLGIDHTKLTYKFQGRQFRLTDVHGNVVREILS
ncbi:sulfatase [Bryobacterales bacterium F-183]|nr:sulfatase [Bryobacterales bacterium F-183]